jgi:hypothetical protein
VTDGKDSRLVRALYWLAVAAVFGAWLYGLVTTPTG